MIIKISNLSDGVHNFSFDEPVGTIGLTEPFFDNFKLEAEIMKSHNQIILNAEIKLNAEFDCDRCTVNYKTMLSGKYQMVYLFGKKPEDDDEGFNIKYLPLETDKIDLTQDLRDYAVLAIPMKKLCMEDCRGLCPECGKSLNETECNCGEKEIDARWLPLMELKKKLSNN
jgi:uncharacterized protein